MEQKVIKPQPGPQEKFLSSNADIAIYGGSAGGGKTYSLLLEPLRHFTNPLFRGVIFRKTSPQIRNVGGLWDESSNLYSCLGLVGRETNLDWQSVNGWHLKFSHLEQENDKYNWQGSQMCFLGFDELTHFSEGQFFYLLSRVRSTSGIKGYIRATCNPDSDSWVASFIAWWIDQGTGYPILERSGLLRWFVRINDNLEWADTPEELSKKYGNDLQPRSVTFVAANVFDNKILMEKDPFYLANLKALQKVDREKLLYGNWKIRPSSGLFFKEQWLEVVTEVYQDTLKIRFWDRAATEENGSNDPDYTVGLLLSKSKSGYFYIEDVVRFRGTPHKVEHKIIEVACKDGKDIYVGLAQDPGQAGKVEASYLVRNLIGFNVLLLKEIKSKILRAKPVSVLSESGNLKILRANWNGDLIRELENFPDAIHDDQVDALSGAYELLSGNKINTLGPRVRTL